jgi:hypothetical protein
MPPHKNNTEQPRKDSTAAPHAAPGRSWPATRRSTPRERTRTERPVPLRPTRRPAGPRPGTRFATRADRQRPATPPGRLPTAGHRGATSARDPPSPAGYHEDVSTCPPGTTRSPPTPTRRRCPATRQCRMRSPEPHRAPAPPARRRRTPKTDPRTRTKNAKHSLGTVGGHRNRERRSGQSQCADEIDPHPTGPARSDTGVESIGARNGLNANPAHLHRADGSEHAEAQEHDGRPSSGHSGPRLASRTVRRTWWRWPLGGSTG